MVAPTRAIRTSRRFSRLPKLSRIGVREDLPEFLSSRKAGDSCSLRRIKYENTTSTIETRNGRRQPQAAKRCSPSWSRQKRTTPRDTNRPSVAVVWMNEV